MNTTHDYSLLELTKLTIDAKMWCLTNSWAVHRVIQDTLSEVSRVSITLAKLFERGTYGNETHCSCFCAVRAVVEAFDQENIGVTE
jgi:hypothetical protein